MLGPLIVSVGPGVAVGVVVGTGDVTTMKTLLAGATPYTPGIGISVYESFMSDQATATGIIPMPGANEQLLGGHAIDLVGFNDAMLINGVAGAFIFKNSWSNAWGAAGYGFLPYAYVANTNLASDCWAIVSSAF